VVNNDRPHTLTDKKNHTRHRPIPEAWNGFIQRTVHAGQISVRLHHPPADGRHVDRHVLASSDMTDLECSTRDGEAMPVPLRGRTITARPELVSDPDKVRACTATTSGPDRNAAPDRSTQRTPVFLARCNLVVRATLRSMHIEPVRRTSCP
jgi:hypothetical protein